MYTQFFIKMPSKGNKTIVSRMIKDVQPNYTIKDFFKTDGAAAARQGGSG